VLRAKDHVRPAVVLGPIARENPALGLQPHVQRGTGEWRQDIERGVLHPGRLQEVQRLLEHCRRVVVETEDNPGLHCDSVGVNPLDRLRVLVHAIEPFRDAIHAGLGDGFEADEQLLAPTARGQLQERVVPGRMNARLATPQFPMRGESAEQVLSVVNVRRDFLIP